MHPGKDLLKVKPIESDSSNSVDTSWGEMELKNLAAKNIKKIKRGKKSANFDKAKQTQRKQKNRNKSSYSSEDTSSKSDECAQILNNTESVLKEINLPPRNENSCKPKLRILVSYTNLIINLY